MRITLILLVFVLLFAGSAPAATLKENAPVCVTHDLLEQLMVSILEDDDLSFEWLLKNGCSGAKADMPITVIRRAPNGRIRVRVYFDGEAQHSWTTTNGIRE